MVQCDSSLAVGAGLSPCIITLLSYSLLSESSKPIGTKIALQEIKVSNNQNATVTMPNT